MPEDACDNVHSQSRRMIMVSPEPGFWIHTVSCCNHMFVLRTPLPLLRFFAWILVVDSMVIVHRAGKDTTPPAHEQGKGQGGD